MASSYNMSGSLLIKTILSDIEDLTSSFTITKEDFEEDKSIRDSDIAHLKSPTSTHESSISALTSDKQDKLNELELDLILSYMTRKPMLRGEVASVRPGSTLAY